MYPSIKLSNPPHNGRPRKSIEFGVFFFKWEFDLSKGVRASFRIALDTPLQGWSKLQVEFPPSINMVSHMQSILCRMSNKSQWGAFP
jgi:hypothetical protein